MITRRCRLNHQALRALTNRLVSILHGCLDHRSLYNEDTAWAHRQPLPLKETNKPLDTRRPWGV